MSALTVRLPDDKHRRLKELSRQRKISVSKLIDEMTTLMLADFDAETRFQLRATRGQGKTFRGLELLEKAKKQSYDQRS
ncbi:ribbon-helix-helix domain-containing protein [Acidithiobacillus thiooxidans]|uniref:ribbon-helix-helix domain-containing protein n=1 Tax=Acidithiobacillus thiooxidans TaxID=930 RepID=UPI001C077307|nr:ribbon-helix-helix domain-containing protein [Acidithiobacillus thiooxidans]MBU2841020.1 ribbon-helix-helix domain-containing protein [Acidithiobacillus thiooxidans]